MIEQIKTESFNESAIVRGRIDSDNLRSIATNSVLIILCVIASFVSFWDIRLTFNDAFSVGWVAILLYLVSTTVYRTKYDGGIYRGRQTEEYKTTMQRFCNVRQVVYSNALIDELREWCISFRVKEMKSVKREIICPYMSFEEYETKYANLSTAEVRSLKLSKKAKSAINRCNRIEPVELTSDMLLNVSAVRHLFGRRKILPRSGDEQRATDFLANYAKKFFITFVCGMFLVSVVSNPTLESFLQWLIRMIPVVTAFLTGGSGGFKNATEVTQKRLDKQSRIICEFFADKGIEIPHEKEETLCSDNSGDRAPKGSGELYRPAK